MEAEVEFNKGDTPIDEEGISDSESINMPEVQLISSLDGAVTTGRQGYIAAVGPRLTTPYMTKYEKTRVVGTRALQISLNAPVYVDSVGITCPITLAELEMKAGTLPFIIRRYLPGRTYEDWAVNELIVDFS